MIERLHQILIKEFIHLFRDKRARFALIIPPLLQMMIFGYAATYEVKHVSTAVLDSDHSQESRQFIERFTSSNRFDVRAMLTEQSQVADLIDHRRVVLVMQIHAGFAEKLRKGETAPVQAILDGTDSNTALIAIGYINQIATKYATEYQLQRAGRMMPAAMHFAPRIQLEERPLYNGNLESRWFFVPGVIGTLLLLSVITLTAFAVVREREIGTLEQLMVRRIDHRQDAAVFVGGSRQPDAGVDRGHAMVSDSVSRQSAGAVDRDDFIFVERARRRAADLDALHDAAASVLAGILLRHAGDHALRFRLPGAEHASIPAVGDVSRSAAIFPDRVAQHFSERRGT